MRQRNSRRILATVHGHIDVEGIENSSMQQIADAAGVSVRTLYNLFGDRPGLIRALLYQSLDDVDVAIGELDANDPIERIWEAVHAAIGAIVASLPAAVLTPVLADNELVWQLSRQWHVGALVTEEIIRAQAAGQLYDDLHAEDLINQVGVSLIHLLRGWAAGVVDEDELRAGALYAVDICLLAIARPDHRDRLRDHALALAPLLADPHLYRNPDGREPAAS